MAGRGEHLLLLGDTENRWIHSRRECCDVCSRQLWLPKEAVTTLDDEEDRELQSEVLCVDCGYAKYGSRLINAIRTHTGI